MLRNYVQQNQSFSQTLSPSERKYASSFNFGLSIFLHACFLRILYSMLLEKMEVISRVEYYLSRVVPFDRVLTLLEVIGLHDFRSFVNFTSLPRL